MKPKEYEFWPQAVKDRYDEREAIMREGNNLPLDVQTPKEIMEVASAEAKHELREIQRSEVPLKSFQKVSRSFDVGNDRKIA